MDASDAVTRQRNADGGMMKERFEEYVKKKFPPYQSTGNSPLKIFNNVIRNLLGSWLDSKIPDFILEIPGHQRRKACHVISNIRKVTTNGSKILKFTDNLSICVF